MVIHSGRSLQSSNSMPLFIPPFLICACARCSTWLLKRVHTRWACAHGPVCKSNPACTFQRQADWAECPASVTNSLATDNSVTADAKSGSTASPTANTAHCNTAHCNTANSSKAQAANHVLAFQSPPPRNIAVEVDVQRVTEFMLWFNG